MKRKRLEIAAVGLKRFNEFPEIRTGCGFVDEIFGMRISGEISGEEVDRLKDLSESEMEISCGFDFFEALPDDLVRFVLCKLCATADSPANFVNISLTCKRLNGLCLDSPVLLKASPKLMTVKAGKWSGSAHKFLMRCVQAGNLDACYSLGMIRFYCLQKRISGASLMAKTAIGGHTQALYSLAVIQFNGSGGSKNDKNLRAGVALCARAAFLGHVDALRELGHCLQDGYGIKKNKADGRMFLIQASALEAALIFGPNSSTPLPPSWLSFKSDFRRPLTDLRCKEPAPVVHPVNQFLAEWFSRDIHPSSELRLCSNSGCGRPETRRHEFRRCSICGSVNYCSRACQALDWKLRHKVECFPDEIMMDRDVEDGDGGGDDMFHWAHENPVGG